MLLQAINHRPTAVHIQLSLSLSSLTQGPVVITDSPTDAPFVVRHACTISMTPATVNCTVNWFMVCYVLLFLDLCLQFFLHTI